MGSFCLLPFPFPFPFLLPFSVFISASPLALQLLISAMCFAHMSTSGSRTTHKYWLIYSNQLSTKETGKVRQSRDECDPLTMHAFIWGDRDLLCYRDNWQESKVIVNSAGGQLPRRIHWCLPLVQSEENKQEPLQMIIVPLMLHSITYCHLLYTTQRKHTLGCQESVKWME